MRSRTPIPAYSVHITIEEVVLRLGVASDMANDDLEKVAADRPWLNRQAYSTAQSLVQFRQFRDWFIGTGSHLLFVEGEDLGESGGSSSVLSTLCVDISESISRLQFIPHSTRIIIHRVLVQNMRADGGTGKSCASRRLT